MITTLEKLGLSEKEANVYLAVLELGASNVQNIAQKAGVNRATTYVILETLAKKGLASSYEKGKKTFFTAENPEQLERLLKRQEDDLETKHQELKKLIPELKAIFNLAGNKPKVKFYEGMEGLKAMQQDALRASIKAGEIYAFTPLDRYLESFPQQETVINRVQRKVRIKVIYTHKNGPVKNASSKKDLRIARFVPRNKFPFESMIDIFPRSTVRIYNFKPTFMGVMIENPQVAKTLKAVFDLAWESAEKYD